MKGPRILYQEPAEIPLCAVCRKLRLGGCEQVVAHEYSEGEEDLSSAGILYACSKKLIPELIFGLIRAQHLEGGAVALLQKEFKADRAKVAELVELATRAIDERNLAEAGRLELVERVLEAVRMMAIAGATARGNGSDRGLAGLPPAVLDELGLGAGDEGGESVD